MGSQNQMCRFSLASATVEDIPDITQVYLQAFGKETLSIRMFPHTPGVRKWWEEANTDELLHNPHARFLKVVDADAEGGKEKIVGYAKYVVPVDGKMKIEDVSAITWPEDSDADLCNLFFGQLDNNKKKIMGDRTYIVLELLATLPEYQGKGVGSMLLRWGCEQADRDGLQLYLDASPAGKPLYEKHGFLERAKSFIPEVQHVECHMVRSPKSA
ncbi:hypothetical protein BZG36_02668 [Bifiguratus adelaidae]|uniref:N-acetyltransferase domain-containing protein n=1 Tax=Bifiguratus adelaidae TaxID=1938954 RepID=A0A261Y1K3_9FUNG|nr:hypothetical protein BZG36_02668 [Bifiguratus adelaidae]